jgi:hypothetical protein
LESGTAFRTASGYIVAFGSLTIRVENVTGCLSRIKVTSSFVSGAMEVPHNKGVSNKMDWLALTEMAFAKTVVPDFGRPKTQLCRFDGDRIG